MDNFGDLFNVLMASEAIIDRAAVRVPGYDAPLAFRFEINTLRRKQAQLRQRLLDIQAMETPNLGVAPLIIAAGAGAVVGLSAIGGWIYSHFTDAKKLDAQTQVYQDLRHDGTGAQDAAQIVYGGATDWGSVMNKLLILSLVGAGVFVLGKFVK